MSLSRRLTTTPRPCYDRLIAFILHRTAASTFPHHSCLRMHHFHMLRPPRIAGFFLHRLERCLSHNLPYNIATEHPLSLLDGPCMAYTLACNLYFLFLFGGVERRAGQAGWCGNMEMEVEKSGKEAGSLCSGVLIATYPKFIVLSSMFYYSLGYGTAALADV